MLKQLIQRLLDSRTTPQQAKNCNDLDFSKEITVLNTTAISSANFTYIVPDAGYIYRWIQCSGKSGTAMGTDIVVNGKRMSGLAINNGDFEFGETLRVNKGASVKFGTWGISTLAQYLVKFVPLGGYKHLIQLVRRTSICLSPSFNCLQKRFSRARKAGLVFRVCHQLQKRLSLQRWTLRGDNILPRRTVTSFFLAVYRNVSCTTRWVLALIMGASHVCLEDLFQSERAGLCTIMSRVQTVLQGSPLRLASLFNLRTGGATC